MGLEAQRNSVLESLPPRPPTPPKETRHEPFAPAPGRVALASVNHQLNLQTPPGINSPAQSATTGTSTGRKRVGFSKKAEYRDPPVYTESGAITSQPTPVSLPSSSSKPVKSILKVATYHLDASKLGNTGATNCGQKDIPAMLDSAMQHLAGANRDSKVDAYMTLNQALKTSNNLPDRAAMQEQIGFFTQCIQRDIQAKTPEGVFDSSLANQALSLLATIIFFPSIATAIPNEFAAFIIDHCTRAFDDAASPKEYVRHLMQVVGYQRFSPKVMTSDRINRLLKSLHTIDERLMGKSIIMARLLVYRQLLRVCRGPMIANHEWLLDLFTDMLSNQKEIRVAAIVLGIEAGFNIGKEKMVTRHVSFVFGLKVEDQNYLRFYEERLDAMSKDKNISMYVPRIWAVVLLLLRIPLDKWEGSATWLRIIQACFNSGDMQTRIEANHAWGRYVYLFHFDQRTLPKNLKNLRQAMEMQLRRKLMGKKEEDLKRAVFGGVYTLIYYALKPGSNSNHLDGSWDNGIQPLLLKLLDPNHEDAKDRLVEVSKILGGLFDATTKRVWKEDRALSDSLVRTEELPPIDSRWLRRNAHRVFAVVGPVLEQNILALADDKSLTSKVWKSLVQSVASAASKEIKVSADTTSFIAHAFNLLQKIWQNGIGLEGPSDTESPRFLAAVQQFLKPMIDSLGLLPFTEKMLSVDRQNCFVPATPSSRPNKQHTPPISPLLCLYTTLSTLAPGVSDDSGFLQFLQAVFTPFFVGKDDKADRTLAQELLSSIPMEALMPYGPWQLAAERIIQWLGRDQSSSLSGSTASQPLTGQEYRDVVKVLERGLRSVPNLPWNLWHQLFEALAKRAVIEVGDSGVAIALIEPLSRVALDQIMNRGDANVSANTILCVIEVLSIARQPLDRQALDAARRRLWGVPNAGHKSQSYDPFEHLYEAVNAALEYLYTDSGVNYVVQADSLLSNLACFIDRCNEDLVYKTLVTLQDGMACWIHDDKRRLGSQPFASVASGKLVWTSISKLFANASEPEQLIAPLERLFCAVFQSSQRHIVNSAATLWNKMFKDTQELTYPEALQPVLIALRSQIDLVLPGLDVPDSEMADQFPTFAEPDQDSGMEKASSTRSSRRNTPRPSVMSSSVIKKSQPMTTRTTRSSKARRQAATPRLRHDNSQIEFTVIESSPVTDYELQSQLLTEHQMEVRERQEENNVLFPALASSPHAKKAALNAKSSEELPKLPASQRAVTPEPEDGFDNYVASTPTPRRGQFTALSELANDPPSSPPEPRRNPLADEIRSRSVSNSIRDGWPGFSSSPVSMSPTRAQTNSFSSHQSLAVQMAKVPGLEEDEDDGNAADAGEDELPTLSLDDEIVEDSVLLGDVPDVSNAARSSQVNEPPSTPKQEPRVIAHVETPKSSDDLYLDALSSPRIASPTRSTTDKPVSHNPGNPSSDGGDSESQRQSQLVVELGLPGVDPKDYHMPDSSPEDQRCHDSIIVDGTPIKIRQMPVRKAKSSPIRPGTQHHELDTNLTNSTSGRGGPKKRKRGASKALEQEYDLSKKAKVDEQLPASDEHSLSVTEVEETKQISTAASTEMRRRSGSAMSEPVSMLKSTRSSPRRRGRAARAVSMDIATETISTSPTKRTAPAESTIQSLVEDMDSDMLDSDQSPLVEAEAKTENTTDVRSALEEEKMVECSPQGNKSPADVICRDETAEQTGVGMGEAAVSTAQAIKDQLLRAMDAMRSARLSRDEVYGIEDIMMDFKRELFEAERRGR